MDIHRVEITRQEYKRITGLDLSDPNISGTTHFGAYGIPAVEYVFVADEPDTSVSEIAWLEELYRL